MPKRESPLEDHASILEKQCKKSYFSIFQCAMKAHIMSFGYVSGNVSRYVHGKRVP